VKLVVEFNNKFELEFDVLTEHRIARRWARKVKAAQRLGYPIDDPTRFYNFLSKEVEVNRAIQTINESVDTINKFQPVVKRHLTDINDQDTLNYLHKIFEDYHGLLDQQTHPLWSVAPNDVKQALADLNVNVHRCESIIRKNRGKPRVVITWYGLPKKHTFDLVDYELLENQFKFGTVYINYVEIGKTLDDFWRDDELGENKHAGAEAFRPFKYFSADLVIRFHDVDKELSAYEEQENKKYFLKHQKYFENLGYNENDACLQPGFIPVARLNSELTKKEILDKLKDNQLITGVYFK
jgi:hypothetical protein